MRILITGGGTGGHINPALAIAGYIRKLHPDWDIAFAGDPNKMEGRLVPAAGYKMYPIKMDGLARRLTFKNIGHNLKTIQTAMHALKAADKILDRFRPDLVIGVGGFVSWPIVNRAAKRKIKTMIHEQNTFPGVTTKLLSGKVDVVLLPNSKAGERLPKAKYKVVVGNPIRDEFIYTERASARRKYGIKPEEFLIVSAGGSLGAKVFNKVMADFLGMTKTLPNCRFVHGTGRGYYEPFAKSLSEAHVRFNNPEDRITVTEFIDDMPTLMTACDLMISRAGASTLAELAVTATPAVLIPSPNVTENHQYHNAKLIEQNGGAVVITENELTANLLYDTVKRIISNRETMENMRKGEQTLAIYDVCDRIYEQLRRLFKQ
ncbi:MAG TPA: UDP-N-acetylglucosamine--N-acetylmuramyl-(pentapeptide) pyrophosphoryl-undecaprenol N-acetylglucosamine transferase [Oscillospiraceae bacterium]|nr:UDP-N-acetylglucosamine--N-acetylmuramyl-(pentapeptide) pyrophosphoryl-undecaprenol N-acetylglucosamine transferase [Oscillospiraceae bacterium]HPK35874.1 UDP-N-acetylglucosamine--N-acetylmuramyl-(pentapeptide) pyrophosphoryl-undecaprenol N-acetylglucosamine transferase [Oscillospiraceae bacterium]HPR76351.1 UDP-N-acetylglucosamine--N-acetylmuramyl-(pentapeptide) pyrophosphoryl-undecaprenol N-acetylglucosamine transferase [Oscillospiraceae bacterium]